METKFIHAADIHLDSPLTHLRRVDAKTAEQLRSATRLSLERVISAALQHNVAAVVIAGDLFDGPVEDASPCIWVESQLRQLVRAGIAVVLIRGNHDALSSAHRVISWGEGITEFGAATAETLELPSAGLAIHGQSFAARATTEDLAAGYPPARDGLFNIGILHTSLGGSSQHDTYAPTSTNVLESKSYDYWALGHIHARSAESLSDRTYIGYSGCTQGRNIRETGPKGCHLVTVTDGQLASVEFVPTDSVRWFSMEVSLASARVLGDVEELVLNSVERLTCDNPGVNLAIRVSLCDATPIHSQLTTPGVIESLSEVLADRMTRLGSVWLEKIKVNSRPLATFDNDSIVQPLGYIERVSKALKENEIAQAALKAELDSMLKKMDAELLSGEDLDFAEKGRLFELVDRAEDLLVARLTQPEAPAAESSGETATGAAQ
ncbi:MAG TPA: DNA repair exonuclease [Planctomycetaceae bacterium]|nr:DNA repair exonuclease [Planctomycetaceae bacterium]